MKILILKGNAPRHNYFANEIKQLKGFDTLILSHKRLSQNRLSKMIVKSPKTFFNRVSKYIFQTLRGWDRKE